MEIVETGKFVAVAVDLHGGLIEAVGEAFKSLAKKSGEFVLRGK